VSKEAQRVADREEERQQILDELLADHGVAWAEQYKPGSYGCHELLDRTAFVANILEEYVLTHPSCVQNEDWFKLASEASAALQNLYQQVGQTHLAEK
jgi:hypothetical protein